MEKVYSLRNLLVIFLLSCVTILGKAQPTFHYAKNIGNATNNDQGLAVTNFNNNILVSGFYRGNTDLNPGAATVNSGGNTSYNHIFFGNYDVNGDYVRARGVFNNGDKAANGIAVNGSGDYYVAGTLSGAVSPSCYFDNFATFSGPLAAGGTTTPDIFFAKYDVFDGYQWAYKVGGTLADEALAIASDNTGNFYITGYFQGSNIDFDIGPGTYPLSAVNGLDIFVAKYDGAGNIQWAINMGGSSSEKGTGIAVDASGNVYVTGTYANTVDFDPSGSVFNLTEQGSNDIFLAKYSSTGALVWAKSMGGTVGDQARGIAVDGSHVYITGYFQGTVDFDPDAGVSNLVSSLFDVFVGKYAQSNGALVWCKGFGGTGDDQGASIAVGSSGDVYVTGHFNGTVDFDPSGTVANKTSAGGEDIFIARFSSSGTYGWAYNIGGTNNDRGNGISVDAAGYIYITGYFQGTNIDFDVTAGSSPLPGIGLQDIFYAKYYENTCAPPTVTAHPTDVNGCTGANASFTITATGAGLNYFWQKNSVNLSDGGSISGANTATLTITGLVAGDAGNYTCLVTGSCPPADISNAAVLTVSAGPSITSQPSNVTVCPSQNANFSVTVSGGATGYQWRKGGVNLSNGGSISGATTASLTITGVVVGDAGNYDCVITTSCGNITSNTASLTVNTAPSISSHPSNATICSGANTTFTVTASGAGLTYQWRKGVANLSDGGIFSGTTTATLTLTGALAGDAGSYNCVVSGTCTPSATSNNATLTINAAPSISSHPSNATICSGANTTFTVTASGAGLTYQWRKGVANLSDGGIFSGTTTATLTLTGALAGDAGNYNCVVSGTCTPAATSNDATLTINTAPSISSHPSNASVCTGNNTSFTVTASGAGLTYQWRKGGVNVSNGGSISGATSATLTITGVVAGDAGNYDCVVSGTCTPSATSNAASLTVGISASITLDPSNQTVCAGSNASFSVTASGASYQWQRNGVDVSNGGSISGATSTTLTITGVVAGDAGNYHCVVNGCPSNLTSADASLTVNTAPSISSHPSASSVCSGGNATFTVTASGTGLTYQWRKGGVNVSNGGSISGATSASLTITGVVAGDAGNYDCVVSGTCTPSATSNTAALTVGTSSSITLDPSNQTTCEGQNVNLSVTATGSSFRWQKGGVDIFDGGNISGAATTTLTITGATLADAGTYHCVVNGCPSNLTSADATLTVNTLPAISSHPSGTSICPGTNVNFSVTASGTGLTYQWQLNGGNISDGGSISGATTNSLTIIGVVAGDAGDYTCIVSGTCTPSVTSNIATLTVLTAASITVDPTDQGVCEGGNATLTATATGSSFKWQKGGVDVVDGGTISGATTTTLTITGVVAGDAGNYTLIAVGCPSNQTSAIAVLTVNTAPSISSHPSGASVCPGANTTFNVTASGSGLTYQWQLNGGNISDGGSISGATTNSLTITGVVAGDAGDYTCIVSGTCTPSVTSNIATLSVGSIASITVDPTDQGVCEGGNATLTATATGSSFKWQKGGVDVVDGGTISGATTTTLTITGVVAGDAGNYTLIAQGCPSDQTSAIAVLTVNTAPAITTHPADQNTCTGNNVTLTVVATGSGLTYQWQLNGGNISDGGSISGATTNSLTITGVTAGDIGNYTCDVSGTCTPMVTSNIAAVAIVGAPSVTTEPTDQSVCTGQDATFTLVASNAVSYLWYKNGVAMSDGGNISGSTTASLTITSTTVADQDNYYCEITGCSGTINSATVNLSVGATTVINTHPSDVTQCSGNNASFTVSVSGSSLNYQWQKDGVDVTDGGTISGATTTTLDITGTVAGDAGSYTCIITSLCAVPLTSNAAVLTVDVAPAITTHPVSTGACTGQNITLTVTATGSNLTYQWQKNSSNMSDGGTISGSTTASLNISSIVAGDAADYTCIVSGTCAPSVTSNIATVTIGAPPAITTQPSSVSGCTGNPVSFTVAATGSGLTYQWQKNGVNISDAGTVSGTATAMLSISSIVAGDAGTYRCVVSSACATSVTSATATLTVGSSTATITGQPVNATVCTGQDASFFVTVSGSGVTYQWQKNGVSLVNGGNISGATSFALLITNVSSSDLGSYRCLISSGCAVPLISAAAGLSIGSPNILVQPLSSSVCNGVTATFDVIATGVGLTYQWQKDGVNLSNGSGISGATTSSLSISNTIVQSSGDYTCVISSSACAPPATTFVATLTVSQCTDVTDAEAANLTVYPNPNDGHFNVNFYSVSGETSVIHIYSATGTEVYYAEGVEQFAAEELDLSILQAGIYFVKVVQGDRTYEQKLVLKK